MRIALFTDSYHEANGVATVSRQLQAYAARNGYPFFCAYGSQATAVTSEPDFTTVALKRGAASFHLDKELLCDPALIRYKKFVTGHLRAFQPDLVHITGPGDLGVLGFAAAHTLGIPLCASWHTNLHEYAARRLMKALRFAPETVRRAVADTAERESLRACMRFYRVARFLMAPNSTMVDMLAARTKRPAFLMSHGVDLDQYAPRERAAGPRPFRIGYVGRLTAEKNVRAFGELQKGLLAAGKTDFEFLMVGEGGESGWLKRNLQNAQLPGVLRGRELAEAFASMDLFVFPSGTDTFGLVILEAMASGVPVVTTPETGSRVGVQHGVNGYLSNDFTRDVLSAMDNDCARRQMGEQARCFAISHSWRGVFDELYRTYGEGLALGDNRAPAPWGRYFQETKIRA